MSSLYKYNGRWMIQICRNKKRQKISAGKNKAAAETVNHHVKELERAKALGAQISVATAEWLTKIDGKLHNRLIKIGLIEPTATMTWRKLVDEYLATKTRVTLTHEQTEDSVGRYFGFDSLIKRVTKPQALGFKTWLLTKGRKTPIIEDDETIEGLSVATASRRFKCAREMMRLAVDSKWIDENPFDGIAAGKQSNPNRAFFVDRELTAKVIAQLPNDELKLIFALGRWAGFRIPSEPFYLQWSNIDWQRSAMTFRVSKLEHIEGLEYRTCPIFPELRPYLLACQESANGSKFCCPWLRSKETNLKRGERLKNAGQAFTAHVKRALSHLGIDPWPKLLVNLRATRATEVDAEFGAKAESEWIGHSAETALRHYVMVTDDTWQRAVQSESKTFKNAKRK